MLQVNRRLVSLAVVLAAWLALGWSSALAAERVYFYHTDAAGTPLAITNTNGQVVWETDYLPFGEPSTVTAQIKNTTMFTGKEHDPETGLYDFGARYLAADVGRFFAPDSVRAVDPVTSQANTLLIQNPQRLNLYAYGLNNPYRFIDPDGNIVWDIVDLAFFSYSYYRFVDDPSWSTGIDLALDGIGLLPIVPALGTIKRVGQEGLEQVAKRGAQRSVTKSGLGGARYAQKTYNPMFSMEGKFAGKSVDDVAAALRSGSMKPSDVPIDYIVRDSNTLILNTRSAQALEAAGIPRSQWNAVNRTGQEFYENLLSGQLQRNRLTSEGIGTVRRSGGL